MILSETIQVKTKGNKKLKHYNSLGYNTSKEFIEVYIKDLPLSISNEVLVKCDYCGTEHYKKYVDYNRVASDTKYACSRKCGTIKAKETIENSPKKDHPLKGKKIDPDKLNEIIQKRINTNIEKYGVEHVLQKEEIKEKFKKTNIKKYGTDNYAKTDEFIERQRKNTIDKYGVTHISKLEETKEKIRRTNIKKYGVPSTLNIERANENRLEVFKSEEHRKDYEISNHKDYIKYIGNSTSLFMCEKGHEFRIKYDNYKSRLSNNIPLCTTCYPINSLTSIKEEELYNHISSLYNKEVIKSHRDITELDIYIPSLNIGFEFNGLYWHSNKFKDKNYHLNKTNYFKKKNIRVIHIWEDEWDNKKEIILSQTKNLLNKSNRIGARKCKVIEINDTSISKGFLNENHIQGNDRSNIKIGLYYEGNLVSIMTFDKSEGRKKMPNGEWNLSRFCNLKNTTIMGGFSKLLKYFIKTYSPNRIISYADRSWSEGNVYTKNGFTKISETRPDYKYLVNNQRIHKSRYRKSYTGISESDLDILKIYDCGKLKFEMVL